MVWAYICQQLEPERRKLSQDLALFRNSLLSHIAAMIEYVLEDDIKGGNLSSVTAIPVPWAKRKKDSH
jgi:hypothetical protein